MASTETLGSSAADQHTALRVSVVIPCLNEAENIRECVLQARSVLTEHGIAGEVVVVDNGSTDGSGQLAREAGAIVIAEPRRGYGSAYLAGLAAAQGDVIVMADADLTYDFNEIPRFLHEFDQGAELVMGNRMENIQPGAMPWLNRHIGNPLLSGFLNVLYKTGVKDVHCGMRAIKRGALVRLDLRSRGMEFASEMVIRAAKEGLEIREFPIEYHPRRGESKLAPFRDGWRHLRLILVYSPTFLFVVPGAILTGIGALLSFLVLAQIELFGREWLIHTLVAGAMLFIIGIQLIGLGLCGRAYGVYYMGERDRWFERMEVRFSLEHGLLLGATVTLAGIALGGVIMWTWIQRGFGTLGEERLAILSATLVIAGIQVVFTSFLLSILGLRRPE